jgi:hypothetical protein
MNGRGFITISMHELERVKIIEAVVQRRLTIVLAAERLHLSWRQVERLTLRYRSQGASGLLSRHRGHPSNYQLADGVAERALNLIRDSYADFGPTLACEKLRECHGLALSKETVRHQMTDVGLWIPRRQRPPKVYQPRARSKFGAVGRHETSSGSCWASYRIIAACCDPDFQQAFA